MGLTKSQQTLVNKARTAGGSELSVSLDDGICSFITATIIHDLKLADHFPEIPSKILPFFGSEPLTSLRLDGVDFLPLLIKLIKVRDDADTYFYCLAILHKARLKYERILQAQATPTIDQIGPRGLLQYGSLTPKALAGFMFWRKWIFDIDNRAGQETGYVFEPIIAYAIGGAPYSAKKSPVRRGGTGTGRQVDCILDKKAYEMKLRVTIAASGQGRWSEELKFPHDCLASQFTPILIVLDPTSNPKLEELKNAFIAAKGEVYIGTDAWTHLSNVAGQTMAQFLQRYVHEPIQALLREAPDPLPNMTLIMRPDQILIKIGDETLPILRSKTQNIASTPDTMPEDVGNDLEV